MGRDQAGVARSRRLGRLLKEIRDCDLCADSLPHPPRPVLAAAATARILIAGQAPGRRVHQSGIPWNDPSGDRLRDWLGLSPEEFYDASRVAIIPMGFCYPGQGRSGDLPPRKECAPAWQARLLSELSELRLTLVIGAYAQKYHLGPKRAATLTATVERWQEYGECIPLPHPSPRNIGWRLRNPWFEEQLVPALRERVRAVLGGPSAERDR